MDSYGFERKRFSERVKEFYESNEAEIGKKDALASVVSIIGNKNLRHSSRLKRLNTVLNSAETGLLNGHDSDFVEEALNIYEHRVKSNNRIYDRESVLAGIKELRARVVSAPKLRYEVPKVSIERKVAAPQLDAVSSRSERILASVPEIFVEDVAETLPRHASASQHSPLYDSIVPNDARTDSVISLPRHLSETSPSERSTPSGLPSPFADDIEGADTVGAERPLEERAVIGRIGVRYAEPGDNFDSEEVRRYDSSSSGEGEKLPINLHLRRSRRKLNLGKLVAIPMTAAAASVALIFTAATYLLGGCNGPDYSKELTAERTKITALEKKTSDLNGLVERLTNEKSGLNDALCLMTEAVESYEMATKEAVGRYHELLTVNSGLDVQLTISDTMFDLSQARADSIETHFQTETQALRAEIVKYQEAERLMTEKNAQDAAIFAADAQMREAVRKFVTSNVYEAIPFGDKLAAGTLDEQGNIVPGSVSSLVFSSRAHSLEELSKRAERIAEVYNPKASPVMQFTFDNVASRLDIDKSLVGQMEGNVSGRSNLDVITTAGVMFGDSEFFTFEREDGTIGFLASDPAYVRYLNGSFGQ